MSGREATRQIKSMPGGESVAIIALTATAFDEDREMILLDGCDDFVRKPFRKNEIFDILGRHLDVQFTYREEQPQITSKEDIPGTKAIADLQTLADLHHDWIEELHQAAASADLYRILALIKQIETENPDFAKVILDLAERYDYQEIIRLIENAGGNR